MQLPTNYKMGTGLAATIMGQQAGLEQEKMGLENLYKGMQMPGEILKGQEQAMLLNDPNYLQQKVSNTLIDLQNKYKADEMQQFVNEVGRAKLEFEASGGNPAVLLKKAEQLGYGPGTPLYQQIQEGKGAQVLERMLQGGTTILANMGGAKQAGEMAKQELIGKQHMDVAELNRKSAEKVAGIGANAQLAAADRYLRKDYLTAANQWADTEKALTKELQDAQGGQLDQLIAAKIRETMPPGSTETDVQKAAINLIQQRIAEAQQKRNEYEGYAFGKSPKITPRAPATSPSSKLPPGVSVVSPK